MCVTRELFFFKKLKLYFIFCNNAKNFLSTSFAFKLTFLSSLTFHSPLLLSVFLLSSIIPIFRITWLKFGLESLLFSLCVVVIVCIFVSFFSALQLNDRNSFSSIQLKFVRKRWNIFLESTAKLFTLFLLQKPRCFMCWLINFYSTTLLIENS